MPIGRSSQHLNLGAKWQVVIMATMLAFTVGCTRDKKESSSLSIQLPQASQSISSSGKLESVSATSAADWGLSDPTTYSEISCYAVTVSAPDLSGIRCLDSSGVEQFKVGLIGGLYPAGSQVVLDVPAGDARTVRLIGVKGSTPADCSRPAISQLNLANYSAPFVLGQTTVNLTPGNQNISISASLVAANKFHRCVAPGIAFGPTDDPPPSATPAITSTLTTTPASVSSLTTLAATVGGSGIVTYKYKVGLSGSTDCTSASGYSSAIPVGTLITDDISGLGDGSIKICALGIDGNAVEQSLASATSYTWTKDTTNPSVAFTSPAGGSWVNSSNQASISISGTCSENGQNINYSGDATGTTTCTGGTWSASVDLSGAGEGSITINANHNDLAGNAATLAALSLNKDITAPTVAFTSPAGGSWVYTANQAALSIAGTCSENGQSVSISGDASGSATCTSGVWSTSVDASGAANGSITINANQNDTAGNAATQASLSLTKDTSAPTVSFTSPAGGSWVNSGTQASLSIAGTCSENGQSVFYSGAASGSTVCSSGTWGASVDVSGAGQGSIFIFADHADVAGNNASQASRTLNKDTVAPSTPTISIDSGAGTAYSTSVALSLSATGASDMYVTNTAGCASGGALETYSSSRAWTLGGTNSTQTVYVKFLDAAGNVSSCVSDNILHQAPAVLSISEIDPYDYGSLAVGGSSDHTFTVTNIGVASATSFTQGSFGSHFNWKGGSFPGTGGTCAGSLAGSANCTVVVTYSPVAGGLLTDTIQINYNDGAGAQSATRDVQGTGVAPVGFALGFGHSCLWNSAGNGKCWGLGGSGELGNGSTSNQMSSVAISGGYNWSYLDSTASTTCGVTAGNSGYCWGYGSGGQLGIGSTTNQTSPQLVTGTWSKIVVGDEHGCGLATDNTISCWGTNTGGELGDGTTTPNYNPASISGGGTFTDLDTNGIHVCAITTGGAIKCWGDNTYGQLGNNSLSLATSQVVSTLFASTYLKVATGSNFTCAIRSDSSMECIGAGTLGQLGNGTSTSSWNTIITVSGGGGWTDVSAGSGHVCGLKTNDLYCWGFNVSGQLGDGTYADKNTPTMVSGTYSKVFAGYEHTCAITMGGALKCWGKNTYGQLGNGNTTTYNTPQTVNP